MPSDIDGARSAVRARRHTILRGGAWLWVAAGPLLVTTQCCCLGRWGANPKDAFAVSFYTVMTIAIALAVLFWTRNSADLPEQSIPVEPQPPWANDLVRDGRHMHTVYAGGFAGLTVVGACIALVVGSTQGPAMSILLFALVGLYSLGIAVVIPRMARAGLRWAALNGSQHGLKAYVRWAPLGVAYGAQARAFLTLGARGTAQRLMNEMAQTTVGIPVRDVASYCALLVDDAPQAAARGFHKLHATRPASPFGALGLSDVLLGQCVPTPLATKHVLWLSSTRLWHSHLMPYAHANLARSHALLGDTEAARSIANEVERDVFDAPARRKAAVLHRLACAWRDMDAERADDLLTQASELDPHGDVGHRARQGLAPAPEWP